VFVHISAVERARLASLNEGQTIEYKIVSTRGQEKESADNLKTDTRTGDCSARLENTCRYAFAINMIAKTPAPDLIPWAPDFGKDHAPTMRRSDEDSKKHHIAQENQGEQSDGYHDAPSEQDKNLDTRTGRIGARPGYGAQAT
jgi:hypothetical protein